MRRAKRTEVVAVKTKKIEKYWSEDTNALFDKVGITTDSNEEGTCPNVDPTIPLLQHIMAAVGSLAEVRAKYTELGPEFRTTSSGVNEYFTGEEREQRHMHTYTHTAVANPSSNTLLSPPPSLHPPSLCMCA